MTTYEIIMVMFTMSTLFMSFISIIVTLLLVIIDNKKENNK